jgi:hypothetical protein
MREKLATIALAMALTAASSGACAMSAPQLEAASCRVVGGDKLPQETGGADALCRAIKEAVAARAPKLQYSAAVRVLSTSSLAATVKFADGPGPHQSSDREVCAGACLRNGRNDWALSPSANQIFTSCGSIAA